jgi:hypothetical protein
VRCTLRNDLSEGRLHPAGFFRPLVSLRTAAQAVRIAVPWRGGVDQVRGKHGASGAIRRSDLSLRRGEWGGAHGTRRQHGVDKSMSWLPVSAVDLPRLFRSSTPTFHSLRFTSPRSSRRGGSLRLAPCAVVLKVMNSNHSRQAPAGKNSTTHVLGVEPGAGRAPMRKPPEA